MAEEDDAVGAYETGRRQRCRQRERPSGELRVTTTLGLGAAWLTPRLGEFLDLYPDVKIDLILTDEELEAAIASVKASIEAETGMSEPELADRFEKVLASGENTYELDGHLMRGFVNQVKREYRLNG